tara:strand:- start:635 stop:1498 length:864 start_codon:yes stop_codon:yes gene_type:complete
MKKLLFNILSGSFGKIIGRNNLVRYGNFITRAGRLDFPNGLIENGETLVQRSAISFNEKKRFIVIDCGANKGEWTHLLYDEFVSNTNHEQYLTIYSFEPSSYTYDKLLTNTRNFNNSSNVETFSINKALSNYEGHAKLNIVHPGAGVNSLVETQDNLVSDIEKVELTTLDIFTKKENIEYIDLLKIDAEGHDPVVIKGANELISLQKIGIIQFEYNWRWIYGNHLLYDIFKSLTKYDYCIGKVTPSGIQFYKEYNVELENFTEGNYIACLNKYVNRFKQVECWLSDK